MFSDYFAGVGQAIVSAGIDLSPYRSHKEYLPQNECTSIFLAPVSLACLDDDFHVAAVFYDIKKVFDTLNHEILLNMMINSGIRGKGLQLIKSYLCGRKIRVEFGGKLLI